MPQKALLKPGKKIEKKKAVANRHGKLSITKKGRFEKPPKDKKKLAVYMENKDLTRSINAQNELTAACKAQERGGQLKMVRSPPPVLAPKGQKAAKQAASKSKPGSEDMEEQ